MLGVPANSASTRESQPPCHSQGSPPSPVEPVSRGHSETGGGDGGTGEAAGDCWETSSSLPSYRILSEASGEFLGGYGGAAAVELRGNSQGFWTDQFPDRWLSAELNGPGAVYKGEVPRDETNCLLRPLGFRILHPASLPARPRDGVEVAIIDAEVAVRLCLQARLGASRLSSLLSRLSHARDGIEGPRPQ